MRPVTFILWALIFSFSAQADCSKDVLKKKLYNLSVVLMYADMNYRSTQGFLDALESDIETSSDIDRRINGDFGQRKMIEDGKKMISNALKEADECLKMGLK